VQFAALKLLAKSARIIEVWQSAMMPEVLEFERRFRGQGFNRVQITFFKNIFH
jgi:hypothetical protein